MTASVLDLTKKFELNLTKANIFTIPKMDTKLAVDKSGSMDDEFRCGWVDHAIDLFLAAALKFDDNGVLEVGFFNHSWHDTPDCTVADFGNYTKKHGVYADGGTCYAPAVTAMANRPDAIKAVGGFIKGLFGKKEASAPSLVKAAYLGMITDGDASDNSDFDSFVANMDKRNFLQVIVIGNQVTMSKLAYVGRLPNVHVLHVKDPKKVDDDQFYELICHEKLKTWVDTL